LDNLLKHKIFALIFFVLETYFKFFSEFSGAASTIHTFPTVARTEATHGGGGSG
jgi:hypothetical protein